MSNISRFIGNERGDKICHEDDGCPTELAVLKRFWREQQASTLPEEVANLVELLDEEEVPYEDSLGVALSLTGRTKQYANGKTATLREQVEKLTAALKLSREALGEVQDLIGESHGVYGLHLNGDESPWNELEQGGEFERLTSLNEAIAAIDSLQKGE